MSRRIAARCTGWLALLFLVWGAAGCGGQEGTGQNGAARQTRAQKEAGHTTKRPAAASGAATTDDREARLDWIRGNKAPGARFRVDPLRGWAGLTSFRFDASLSTDDRDLSGQLFRRWDFDGDGTWDTGFSRGIRTGHVFSDSGEIRSRLQVKDTGGLTDSVVGEPFLVLGPCPPPDFAMVDINPNSSTYGLTHRLSEQRGRRVLLWFTLPSK